MSHSVSLVQRSVSLKFTLMVPRYKSRISFQRATNSHTREHEVSGLSALHHHQRQLFVRCLTFNVGSETPSLVPDGLLSPSSRDSSATVDLFAIGTQETSSCSKWRRLICERLAPRGFMLLASGQLMAIQLLLFITIDCAELVKNVQTFKVATGVGNVVGNKGSVGIAITLKNNYRVLFINSHFAAHERRLSERKQDHDRVRNSLMKAPGLHRWRVHKSTRFSLRCNRVHDERLAIFRRQLKEMHDGGKLDWTLLEDADLTFWMGDLNYRVEGNRRAVEAAFDAGHFEVLRSNDQLNKERKKGRVFRGFNEGHLCFPPTYKFDKGTDVYDTSYKSRIPSWPDRILWKLAPETQDSTVELLSYESLDKICFSDHKPVSALFSVQLNEQQFYTKILGGEIGRKQSVNKLCWSCVTPRTDVPEHEDQLQSTSLLDSTLAPMM